jgi:hypothetical protein
MCLNVLLDNPLRFFKDEVFIGLNPQAINELLNQDKINCTEEQLRHYALNGSTAKRPTKK